MLTWIARVLLSAIAGWVLALAGAVAATGLLDGAEPCLAFGLGRRSLAFPAPDHADVTLTPLTPLAVHEVPWSVRIDRGRGGSATATFVRWDGRTLLITASHVVNFLPVVPWTALTVGPRPLYWLAPDSTRTELPVGRVSYWWDLAVYPVSASDHPALAIAASAPSIGERVQFSGYPSGQAQPWAASGPVVAMTEHPSGGAAAVVVAVAAQTGQSGGPLLNAAGELTGIAVAATRYGVLAVGNGALRETLTALDHLPPTHPPLRDRVIVGITTAAAAVAFALGVDRVLRRVG